MTRGDVFIHATADDGAPVCFSGLLLTGSQTTHDETAVTCPVCLRELARPHRGQVRRELEDAR